MLADQDVAGVEVAVRDDRRRRRREPVGRVQQVADRAGNGPEAEPLAVGQPLARERDALVHVDPAERVVGQVRRDLDAVQRAQERAELAREAVAIRVAQAGIRDLATADQLAAEERPRIAAVRPADEARDRDRERQQRRQLRQHRDLALDAGQRDRAAREAEHPAVVGEPDAVVPALAEQLERQWLELRELAGDQRAGQLAVDHDLRAPLVHGA